MYKVLFIVPTLSHGGAEKIISLLSRQLTGFNVSIALFENKISYPFSGTLFNLGIGYSKRNSLLGKIFKLFIGVLRTRQLKKENEFDVSISFIPICNILNILTRRTEKVYVTVHVNEEMDQPPDIYGWFYKLFMKYCYNFASGTIAVSKSLREQIISKTGLEPSRISVIYDPLDSREIQDLSKRPMSPGQQALFHNPVLLNIGRLCPQKGHSHLIKIFRKITTEVQAETKLVILGEGYLLDELILLCGSLDLRVYSYKSGNTFGPNYDVYFLGFQQNPYSFLKASTLFLFPSLYEGFGIAIIEAMMCGTPVIASDCDFGPREILAPASPPSFRTDRPETTSYGVLMPSFNQDESIKHDSSNDYLERIWTDTVLSLLNRDQENKEWFPRAQERAKEFDISSLIVEWENLINNQNGQENSQKS